MPSFSSRHDVAVLVPVREPEPKMVSLIGALSECGFGAIVVVDDGSCPESSAIFDVLKTVPGTHVLVHGVNLGKGRALKTGINYCLTDLPNIQGVVTADADGQHTVADIVRVADATLSGHGRTVLGCRGFAEGVPWRSRFGNGMTRHIFGFVTGTTLRDTQTGLRGFPRALLPELMLLDGERYEYEMSVLAHICRNYGKPLEVTIQTVYIDGNNSSHFDPVRDSMRIYFVLARFYFSAILAAGIDFLGFTIAFAATGNILASVAIGRLSSLVNFALNKKYVFQSRASVKGTLWRYYVLAAGIAGLSYLLILALNTYLRWNVFAAKVTVDVLLSLVSFSVQRTFVFRRSDAP